MKTFVISIDKLRVNESNPRTMTKDKTDALIKSIILFPEMLSLREIIIDSSKGNVILGGNMRYRALKAILIMGPEEIRLIINESLKFRGIKEQDANIRLAYWIDFQRSPLVKVKDASDLTESEKKEFIIKDNVGFGEWDWDMLASDFDEKDLLEWGMDVWDTETEDKVEGTEDKVEETEDKLETEVDESGLKKMVFNLTEENYERISDALKVFDEVPEKALLFALGLEE